MDGVKALMCDHCHVCHLHYVYYNGNCKCDQINRGKLYGFISPCTLRRNTREDKRAMYDTKSDHLWENSHQLRDRFCYNGSRQAA